MTLAQRRVIYGIFMTVFVIAGAILVFTSSGWRYNFKKRLVQKTGIIFLESKPDKADIYFNGRKLDEQTPLQIKNLLPNDYSVRLEKSGYSGWEKNITVNEGVTTNVQYVRLFMADPRPEQVVAGEFELVAGSENGSEFLLVSKNNDKWRVSYYAAKKVWLKDIFETDTKIVSMRLIEMSRRALIETLNNVYLIDFGQDFKVEELTQYMDWREARHIKVNENTGNSLYFILNSRLYNFNLTTKIAEQVLAVDMLDFALAGVDVYFLKRGEEDGYTLNKINLSYKNNIQMIGSLTGGDEYEIVNADSKFILLKNIGHGSYLMIDELNNEVTEFDGVNDFRFEKKFGETLFFGGNELSVFKPENKSRKMVLLTRNSEAIKAAAWYHPETHIVYAEGGKIKVVENMDNNRYGFELTRFESVKDIFVSADGERLFINGKIGTQAGLFEIKIL